MIVFYDPTSFQVMAYYTHGTDDSTWEVAGYIKQDGVPQNVEDGISRYGRDCRLLFNGSVLTSVSDCPNPLTADTSDRLGD
mgnify:CR=1 FL=1